MGNVKPTSSQTVMDLIPESERRWGYLVDLTTVQLHDNQEGDGASSWVHFLPVGSYKHPLYGKMDFTPERIGQYAENIAKNVRGIDIAIDYGHKSAEEAAGWISPSPDSVQVKPEGLWVLVNWTAKAAAEIRNKVYRYFSPEIADEWQDPKTGTKHKNVALGGGLTNRPFLKDLLPINLSEFFAESTQPKEENVELAEKLRELLKLDEKASEDDIIKAINDAKATPLKEESKSATEELKKLMDENPEVRRLAEEVNTLKTAAKLSEATRMIEKWTVGTGKKFAIPPAVHENLQAVLLDAPHALSEKLTGVIDNLLENGLVELGEKGTRPRERTEGGLSATDRFTAQVVEIQKANPNMSLSEAQAEASRDEVLYAAYRREATSEGEMPEREEA